MLRLRRYRYYVFSAAVILFLLYRIAKDTNEWETVTASFPSVHSTKQGLGSGNSNTSPDFMKPEDAGLSLDHTDHGENRVDIPVLKTTIFANDDDTTTTTSTTADPEETDGSRVLAYDQDGAAKTTTAALIDIPNKSVGQGAKGVTEHYTATHTTSTSTAIHWKKMPEHFPVAERDIIPLPTGTSRDIPDVQHDFQDESNASPKERQKRLRQVKAEMVRSWVGYTKYARGHDELSPVSNSFRDPFCGWAATLVDSLDTLWIMGMEEEFEEALLDVEKIDFTTSTRAEIPVFETTIRYLGGLIAAYDVSGGELGGYDILLTKAIELAEILMGVFDTPNRMPILYYNWRPESVSKPKRAGTGVSVAELGSLAMEFTRLAQITGDNKYYDAVARITNAFHEWQERGTSIPGIFPEHVNAAGCNRTAQAVAEAAKKAELAEEESDLEISEQTMSHAPVLSDTENSGSGVKGVPGLYKREFATDSGDVGVDTESSAEDEGVSGVHMIPDAGKVMSAKGSHHYSGNGRKTDEEPLPECIPQGLDSSGWGSQQYGMGGSQDSTYEYFPKQWLLLGGLEPKYKTLYLNTVAAVKKWLLYRPMLPDNRDILFSAKINTRGDPETDADTEYEVTHLTCFIGGMFGLGGKIFDRPGDVVIGKKLTDGCVWAYESTPSGIMPEGAHVVPCADVNDCHWNQTMYEEWLDPLFDTREAAIEQYYERQAELKKQKAQEEEEDRLWKEASLKSTEEDSKTAGSGTQELRQTSFDQKADFWTEQAAKQADLYETSGLRKRAPPSKMAVPDRDLESGSEDGRSSGWASAQAGGLDDDSDSVTDTTTWDPSQTPLEDDRRFPDPSRPLSHEEYVANKINAERLPTGYVNVPSRRYILRPEAIESVWYMYRITGDKTWQEKGWDMFTAIRSQTSTESGNSAIDDVLVKDSGQVDEMESFWTAETLKYFYLLYSDPDLISLDDWVLNTEAHPFRRPTRSV
ncbi:glycoside hydrolase family 47 protein [Xylariomycetidae sp. FL0641]|nr:glycoside hydrolase family 47 protein [Xylariomycetidae sp. FL0641]